MNLALLGMLLLEMLYMLNYLSCYENLQVEYYSVVKIMQVDMFHLFCRFHFNMLWNINAIYVGNQRPCGMCYGLVESFGILKGYMKL